MLKIRAGESERDYGFLIRKLILMFRGFIHTVSKQTKSFFKKWVRNMAWGLREVQQKKPIFSKCLKKCSWLASCVSGKKKYSLRSPWLVAFIC